jgi:GntR family transcriptional regulator
MLFLDRRSHVPLYLQIAQRIIAQVNSGQLSPRSQLPSERELAENFAVSRPTARQAIEELVEQGIVYRLQGRGTFVAQPKIREVSGLGSFSDDMRRQGLEPSSHVLVQKIVQPDAQVRRKLRLGEGASILQLDRVRLANGRPVALESAAINLHLCPGLEKEDFASQSLYQVLRNRYGVYPEWAEAEIEARGALPHEAEVFGINVEQPVMVAYRLTYTETFEPIEYVNSVYWGDRFTFYIGRQRIPLLTPEEKR